jgi:hypothetical protein
MRQETALRESGFQVITVTTPLQARFEIEMGRCGIFLASSITPSAIYRDLAELFKRNCPDGLVVYLSDHNPNPVPEADLLLPEKDEANAIVRKIRAMKTAKTS